VPLAASSVSFAMISWIFSSFSKSRVDKAFTL
jgi:hypothetical protein